MAKKNQPAAQPETQTQTEIAGAPKRQKKQLSQAATAIITEATNKVKEAKRLAKTVDLIGELGEWSLDQLGAAIERRRQEIKDTPPF